MMRWITTLLLATTALLPLQAEVLWNRAVDLFEANSTLVPGRVEMHAREYGGRNRRLRNEEHGIYRTRLTAEQELETEIVRVVRNGEDITDERRADGNGGGFAAIFGPPPDMPEDQEGEEEERTGGGPGQSTPFDPALQHLVTFSRGGDTRMVAGRRTVAYAFRQQSEDDPEQFVTGTAWLDAQSGAPLLLESTLDPLPSRMLNTLAFQSWFSETADGWFLTRLDVNIVVQAVVVRREFETTISFSEHFPTVR